MNELLHNIKQTLESLHLFHIVHVHGFGLIGIDGFKEFSEHMPSASIGLCSIDNMQSTNENMLECFLNLSIIFSSTETNRNQVSHQESIRVLELVLLAVQNGRWGISKRNITDTKEGSIKATSYYEPNFYGKKIALWRIDWVQSIKLGEDRFQCL